MIIFLFLGGRWGDVLLCSILKFVIGLEEELVLGFYIYLLIVFVKNVFLVLIFNICINKLNLFILYGNMEVFFEDILFNFYDYVFCNVYFGF